MSGVPGDGGSDRNASRNGRATLAGVGLVSAALFGLLKATAERNRPLKLSLPPPAWRRAFQRKEAHRWSSLAELRRLAGQGHHPAPAAGTEPPELARALGRHARWPWQIPPRGWAQILRRTFWAVASDHLGLISAGVAFYMLLALFPALVLAVALVGLVWSAEDFLSQLDALSQLLPPQVAEPILTQAAHIASRDSGGLELAAWAGLLIALYSSSRATLSLIEGLNVAYDEDEKRGLIGLNLQGLALTLGLLAGGLVGVMATVVVPEVLGALGIEPGLLGWFATLRWPILVAGSALGLMILYRFGPSRRGARARWLVIGAVLASVAMLEGTVALAWYVANLARYNQTFGALGGAVVMLLWLWLTTFIVLIGAELNAEIEAQTAVDTTIGPARPPGQRGAVKADRLS